MTKGLINYGDRFLLTSWQIKCFGTLFVSKTLAFEAQFFVGFICFIRTLPYKRYSAESLEIKVRWF